MRTIKPVLITAALTITLASGAALAASDLIRPARPVNSEIGAAQLALDDAMAHLRKVPNPQNRENVRAMSLVKLAQEQLQAEGSLYPIN